MIDGLAHAYLRDQYESITLVGDGSNWVSERPKGRPIGTLLLANDGPQNLVIAPVVCGYDGALGGCGGNVWIKLIAGQGMAPAIATPADWPAVGAGLIAGTALEIDVTNPAGTEQVFLHSLGPVSLPSASTTFVPLDPDDPVAAPVGSDLSYDSGSGKIISAAGGIFLVNLVLVDYTAP